MLADAAVSAPERIGKKNHPRPKAEDGSRKTARNVDDDSYAVTVLRQVCPLRLYLCFPSEANDVCAREQSHFVCADNTRECSARV